MPNFFRILTLLGLCLASFSPANAQDRLERKDVPAKKVVPLNKPGQVLQVSPNLAEVVKKGSAQFINFEPKDKSVVTTSRPIFRIERDLNRRSDQNRCDKSALSNNAAKLTIIKTGTVETTSNSSIVLEEVVNIAPDCRFETTFSKLSLEQNTGYAWSVSGLKDKEVSEKKWNSFFYTTRPVDHSGDTNEPHLCEKNHITDASLLGRKETAWQMSGQTLRRFQPAAIVENGHDDGGAMVFESPREVAFQSLIQGERQSERYQMNLSVKNTGKHNFQVKVVAFNDVLRSLEPSQDVAVVAVTGNIQPFADWVKVTLPPWTAIGDLENLAIVVFNAQGRPISALVDRVCLSFSSDKSCGPSVDMAEFGIEAFEVPDTEPVETEFDYLAGSVSDIYPNQDTQSTDWYETSNEEVFQCTSVGGSFAPGQEEDIDKLVEQTEAFVEANAQDLSLLEDLNIVVPDEETLILPNVGNVNDEKCTARIVDPSRPFSGRDVVYIHGLQKPALEGYKSRPPKFTGRWPADAGEFNAPGGEYFDAAASYWRPHISAGLGNWAEPTNS